MSLPRILRQNSNDPPRLTLCAPELQRSVTSAELSAIFLCSATHHLIIRRKGNHPKNPILFPHAGREVSALILQSLTKKSSRLGPRRFAATHSHPIPKHEKNSPCRTHSSLPNSQQIPNLETKWISHPRTIEACRFALDD